jgi:uncharacterized membrane protein YfcA
MWLLAVPTGLLVGLSLGTLGAGGSILTVPVLVYLLGQDPHDATTISLLVVGVAALAGAAAHHRAGRLRLGTGVVFGLLGAAGSYLGSEANAAVNPHVLLVGFAALMVAAAVAMVVRQQHGPAAPTGPAGGTATLVDRKIAVRTVGAATVVGLLTGFFGVGGGFVVVPALVLALGLDTATAVGTSLIVIAINSGLALATRLTVQPMAVDWLLLSTFGGAAVVGVLAGNLVGARLDQRRLTLAFAGLLVLVAGYTAVTSLPYLL